MGRGLGWVQTACLSHIKGDEEDKEWPTTFDIAASVYEVKPDRTATATSPTRSTSPSSARSKACNARATSSAFGQGGRAS
jgi:hypothetical protein